MHRLRLYQSGVSAKIYLDTHKLSNAHTYRPTFLPHISTLFQPYR